jgi:hypothetical protein
LYDPNALGTTCIRSTAAGDGSNPPTTGWPAGYSVEVPNHPPAHAHPVSPIASPIVLGFKALLTTSKSHDVAFTLKDGETVTAHRLILEAQSPTLFTLASETGGLDDPFPVHYNKPAFIEMINITYGRKPTELKVEQLVDLLKVSNYCGAIASKLHAEEALSTKIDISNCAMLGDLSCTLVCPLLLEACGRVFIAKPKTVMKSEGWKFIDKTTMQYFLEVKCEIVNPKKHSIAELRNDLM